MTFDEVLSQVQALLQREQRVSYRGLKRRFALDDEYVEDLKEELIGAKRLATDEEGRFLVWTGGATEGEKGKQVNGEKGKDSRLRTPNSELPSPQAATRRRISPSASAPSKRQWKRGAMQTVNAKPLPPYLPTSKARPISSLILILKTPAPFSIR